MTVPVETPPIETVEMEEVILQSEWEGGLITDSIRSMVGTPPAGFEFVEYAVAAAVLIILFGLVASVFVGFSKMFGAR